MVAFSRALLALDRPDPAVAERAALLRAHPIFQPLAEGTLEQLARALEPVALVSGADVIRQGDHGDRVYVVVSGELDVEVDGRAGARLGAGDVFGEIALIRDVPRTATVRAATAAEVLTLGRDEFLAAVTGHPASAAEADLVVATRLAALAAGHRQGLSDVRHRTSSPSGVQTPTQHAGTLRGRMAIAREATPVSSAADIKDADLDREDLLQIYRNMLVTRGIEERGHILYRQGKIPGSFYTGRGNEGASVGVATAMRPDDVGTPIQRDMGVHVTRGTEAWRIFAQYMGRRDGLAMGKDGNVHMADIRLGLIAMVSHLPALMPVAVGCALAFKIRREHRVAVGWSGDGAMARGDAHEAMNLAGVHRLPVVFICDNNQYAYSTPNRLEFGVDHLADRAAAYGFEGVVVDGTDVLTVYREAHRAIEKAREGGGPTLLELVTLGWRGTPCTTTRSTSRASCSRRTAGRTRSSATGDG